MIAHIEKYTDSRKWVDFSKHSSMRPIVWHTHKDQIMVAMFVEMCSGRQYFPYYSYWRNTTGRDFFIPARTLIGVKLLIMCVFLKFRCDILPS